MKNSLASLIRHLVMTLIILEGVPSSILAQQIRYMEDDTTRQYIDLLAMSGYTGAGAVPLWMRSNHYGSVPQSGASSSFILRAAQNYRQREWKGHSVNGGSIWDWGYAVEGRINLDPRLHSQLIDAHVKMRFTAIELKLGRSKDVMGLNGDTVLTSGNFAVAGNSLGVPKLEISISEYYRIPWFDKLLSFKGNFSNGYMSKMELSPGSFLINTSDRELNTWLHQKSVYGRLGKPHWKLNLYGGFNHQAQWGGERRRWGDRFGLNTTETLWHVISGKAYGGTGTGIPRSKIGNHQGSVDLGASYDFERIKIMVYRQNFYDVGALANFANIKDGLNGVTLTNKRYKESNRAYDWQTLLFEFFYSKDQAGYPWSRPTKSGDEDYYNNSEYLEGWSYKGIGIGSPLIAAANTVRSGQAHSPKDFFISNRVIAGHLGLRGHFYDWRVMSKLTLARHYGTFATSEYGKSTGGRFHTPHFELFQPVTQFSLFLQGERSIRKRFDIGGILALDQGKLLDNSIGVQVFIRKTFFQKP